MLSSLICTVGGAGDPVGGGDCWDGGAEQVSQVQSLFLRYWAAFMVRAHGRMRLPVGRGDERG